MEKGRVHSFRHLLSRAVLFVAGALGVGLAWMLGLNPMTGVIEGFRWAVLGTSNNPGPQIVVGTVVTAVLLVSGGFYFRRVERFFSDVV